MKSILGIDIAKAGLDVALQRVDGKIRSKVVDNPPQGFAVLSTWLNKYGVTDVEGGPCAVAPRAVYARHGGHDANGVGTCLQG